MSRNYTHPKWIVAVNPTISSACRESIHISLLFRSDSPLTDSERPSTSRYGGGLRYVDHGYDPITSQPIELPHNNSTSSTTDNLSVHNRQQHFVSTTNLNVNETVSSRRQPLQRVNDRPTSTLNHSTPYLSRIGDDDSSTLKSISRQPDRNSTLGNDSGIVMSSSHQPDSMLNENEFIEMKLKELVQQLGQQLESDSQKLNEKLEVKLKNLESMINQQTFIIQRQDEMIEYLRNKILQIESERDQIRTQLTTHEQNVKTPLNIIGTPLRNESKVYELDDPQAIYADISTERRSSSSSSVTIANNNKTSSKKTPAPRIDSPESSMNNERNTSMSKLVQSNPITPDRSASESSAPSAAHKLASVVPLKEKPAAASRLDTIIHQTDAGETPHQAASNYSIPVVRQNGRVHIGDSISVEPEDLVTSVHDDRRLGSAYDVGVKSKRSNSISTGKSSSPTSSVRADGFDLSPRDNNSLAPRNSTGHRSLEVLPHQNSGVDPRLKLSNKTASLDLRQPMGQSDELSAIYVTPKEAMYPAFQSENTVKGWLRKKNPESFFKRIERYYCVLSNNKILFHRQENDRTPVKAVNLQNAEVHMYEDAKYGPSLELTWSNQFNDIKHYELYPSDGEEAKLWLNGIQTAILDIEAKSD